MKTRHIVLLIVIISIGLILVLIPTGRRELDHASEDYPWAVTVNAAGETQILGLILGRSTLAEAEQRFRAPAALALFAERSNDLSLEAFFNEVTLGGLSSRIVLSLSVTPEKLAQMRERSGSGERTDSGATRYRLRTEDVALARAAPIGALTYVPYAQLEAATIEQRFGKPDETIRTSATTVHYLYPAKGLDIMLNDDEREVMQFVPPRDFGLLRQKLATKEGD